jgi:ABC-type proline/glycine betaine transport system ATPase subunit
MDGYAFAASRLMSLIFIGRSGCGKSTHVVLVQEVIRSKITSGIFCIVRKVNVMRTRILFSLSR